MNNTMTRVNGVFEKDFAARMVLIANNDAVIYTNASTDPYSAASGMSNWNSQLQSTLTSVIGEAIMISVTYSELPEVAEMQDVSAVSVPTAQKEAVILLRQMQFLQEIILISIM
jgi:hypothetical protein